MAMKTLGGMDFLLIISKCSISYNVFNRHLLHRRQKLYLWSKLFSISTGQLDLTLDDLELLDDVWEEMEEIVDSDASSEEAHVSDSEDSEDETTEEQTTSKAPKRTR